ncbi:MAG: diaminopimelate decarboxylase [Halioglobus sp.]
MSSFHYQQDQLYAEGVPVAEIARSHGTPTYIYSRAAIERAYGEYEDALAGCRHLVCYAVKANSNLAVLNVLAQMGAGFDIVSLGELERVIAAGGDPSRIVFSGVAKSQEDMCRALQLGIRCFNLESAAELEILNDVAGKEGCLAPVSIRVNPDVDARTHPYISTGLKENKFGIAMDEAMDVYVRAAALPNINVVGLDCHIGSQLTELSPFVDALHRLLSLVDRLQAEGIVLTHLDLGGGLGVNYRDETPPSIADYIGTIRSELGDRPLELIFEPGRSIVANAGILASQVQYLKHTPDHNFAIVDAAMNDMLRPALYQAWLDIQPVQRSSAGTAATWDVVGPVCETADFLGKDRSLCLAEGDLLAIFGAGAYGFVMSSNYNSRGRAAEVMVDGDSAHLVRARETLTDLLRNEHLLPHDAAAKG